MSSQPDEYRPQPTYGAPYPQPPAYNAPTSASPYPYGQPVSAAPQQGYGAVVPYAQSAVSPYGQPYAQPYAGPQLVSAGGRLGAVLLDGLLMMVTLWIGWIIWSMITWSDGQTPGKKLLGHVVADAETGEAFDWARMALREFAIKGLLGTLLNFISAGIFFWIDSFMVLGDRQRTLHDRMANSIVRHG